MSYFFNLVFLNPQSVKKYLFNELLHYHTEISNHFIHNHYSLNLRQNIFKFLDKPHYPLSPLHIWGLYLKQ